MWQTSVCVYVCAHGRSHYGASTWRVLVCRAAITVCCRTRCPRGCGSTGLRLCWRRLRSARSVSIASFTCKALRGAAGGRAGAPSPTLSTTASLRCGPTGVHPDAHDRALLTDMTHTHTFESSEGPVVGGVNVLVDTAMYRTCTHTYIHTYVRMHCLSPHASPGATCHLPRGHGVGSAQGAPQPPIASLLICRAEPLAPKSPPPPPESPQFDR